MRRAAWHAVRGCEACGCNMPVTGDSRRNPLRRGCDEGGTARRPCPTTRFSMESVRRGYRTAEWRLDRRGPSRRAICPGVLSLRSATDDDGADHVGMNRAVVVVGACLGEDDAD